MNSRQVWNNRLFVARLNTTYERLCAWLSPSSFCPSAAKALAIAGCMLAPLGMTEAAQAANRSLTLYNTHTKETTTITYKRGGRFDAAGLRKLNRFLRDWRRNEIIQMDPALFDLIWEVYRQTGAKKPIHVVSGYRSPATNNMLRRRSRAVAKQSRHTRGQAMDFYLPGVPASKIREVGLRLQAGGVGYYPRSNSPFVHIDTGNVRHWPRMSRKQLARVFPNGNTVHVPTDGKPFKGYKAAKAKVARRKVQMAKASRSIGRFTQVAKAAPAKPSRIQRNKPSQLQLAKLARAKQEQSKSPSLLSSLLNRTPKSRPTPAAAPAVVTPAPIELAPEKQATPFKLATLPKRRAPQPKRQVPLNPAPIDLAAADTVRNPAIQDNPTPDQSPDQRQNPGKEIILAALPKPRLAPPAAQRSFTLAAGPKPAGETIQPEAQNDQATRLQLASLPKGSPEREKALSNFPPLPSAEQGPSQPVRAEDAIAQLARAASDTDTPDNRFSYAPTPAPLARTNLTTAAPLPKPEATEPEQQLASLPSANPNLSTAASPRPAVSPKPRQAQQASAQSTNRARPYRDQLAKLTFAYGPASMAHFAHMKQPTQTATFARLSRPAPNNLNGLVAKPARMIDQGFSRKPINIRATNQFAGRAITNLAIRSFN